MGVQARSDSKRLPEKIFQKIGDQSLLEWVYGAAFEAERILRAKKIDSEAVVLGTVGDIKLSQFCEERKMRCFFPYVDKDDLIHRYKEALKKFNAIGCVRITADCWLSNPDMIAEVAELLNKFDYVSNTIQRSFMEGYDLQGCTRLALEWFDFNQKEKREHPFYFFDRNEMIREDFEKKGFKWTNLVAPNAVWAVKTSIDSVDDLNNAREFYERTNQSTLENRKKNTTEASP